MGILAGRSTGESPSILRALFSCAYPVWADSAYLSVLIVEVLALMGFEAHINERAYRNRPLSEEQKTANRERSKIRARVEHVFGDFVSWLSQMRRPCSQNS
jgi:hypothetical protein